MSLAVVVLAAVAARPVANLDTLPVSYYGAAFTRTDANIDMLSKMRVIVLMQQDGPCWLRCCPFVDNATYTAACQPPTMVPLPNATRFAGCDASCDQEGTQLGVFARVAAAAAAAHRGVPQRVLYMNAVYNWPFYLMNTAGVANISVLDVSGNVHAEESDPGIFPSWFIDYGREAGQNAILNAIERAVGDSAADGLFLDNFPDIPFRCDDGNRLPHALDANCTAERSQLKNNIPKQVSKVTAAAVNAYAAGKNDTLLKLGQLIRQKTGGMYVAFVAGSSTYGPDRMANTAVFNYNAPMTPATLAQQINESFANGYKYVIIQPNRFASPVAAGRPPSDHTDMITSLCKEWEIAQFLLAMQHNCFIACNGWSADFTRPLGAPRGPATITAGVMRREFERGVRAEWTVEQPASTATFAWGS